jgi:enoyl-CoA hydratase/carnithine racemase
MTLILGWTRHRLHPLRASEIADERAAGVAVSELIQTEIHDGCATVVLNRPDVMNALTVQMLIELGETLESLAKDPLIRVVLLTGAGRAFCAGVDLNELQNRTLNNGRIGEDFDDAAARVTKLLCEMPKPTIAAINGACFTGGLEIAIACDLMVTACESKLGDTHARWGLRPTWGMTQRLGRAVGPAQARLLSFTARTFSGEDAVRLGLAVACIPAVELMDYCRAIATEIACNSGESILAYKDLYAVAENSFLREGINFERDLSYPFTEGSKRIMAFGAKRVDKS